MYDYESARKEVRRQNVPVTSEWIFERAKHRMMSEFHWNGHITLTNDDVDESHPLHALWEEAHRNLDQLFRQSDKDAGRTLDMRRMKEVYLYIWARCHEAANVYYARGDYKAHLPTRGEVLSLRFAFPPHQANGHVTYTLNMLAACHALHLFQVGDQDWRARAEASEVAERLEDERDFARVYEANWELGQIIDHNLAIWTKNKEDLELCLNKLKAKTTTTGFEQTSEELGARCRVEEKVEETLELMQICQERLEKAQRRWWEVQEEQGSSESIDWQLTNSPGGSEE
ncbi:hypothetical protein BBO_03298 [Beauveria brongniartii RCEF 3172]|uniref:Uncharacterized protein n=1 Tax=Beauveria brongniartii RCEF 3172 TaxID=1081107 RepID=A0A162JSQ6_9HYPO|nr:hypothetical protein BBO_03298 [Beauveria brongniartii RCEF 3172]